MKLGYVILYVENVVETLNFYKKAFNLELKFLHESNAYGEIDTGNTTLSFAANEMAENNGFKIRENKLSDIPAGAEIAFITDDVEKAYKSAIDNGATKCVEPKTKPWGQTVAYVRDNNGFLVELCSPLS